LRFKETDMAALPSEEEEQDEEEEKAGPHMGT
jgi:hypothetical protein